MSKWIESPLDNLAEISSGGTPSRSNDDFWGGEIPWVTPSDITKCKTNYLHGTQDSITRKGLMSSSAKMLPSGALLFTSRATIGEIKITERPVATNQGFKNLVPKNGVDGDFLFYQLSRLKKEFVRYAAGSTFLEINRRDTGRVLVPHPVQLGAQQKLAEIFKTIDETIEKTEALIEKYQQIKAGLMHDLFTRGISADGKLRPPRDQAPELYQQTPIGWIPKDWEMVDLNSEITISHGYAFPGAGFFEEPPGQVLLTPGNFHRNGGLYFTTGNTRYFRGHIPHETILSTGGLVTVMTDLSPQTLILGRFALIDTHYLVLHNQRIGLVKCKKADKWRLRYFASALNNERLRKEIILGATGTTVRHTSPGRILALQIARPSIFEQDQSANVLASIQEKLDREVDFWNKLINQKSGLMHDLLTGKIQVKVDQPEATHV